MGQGRLKAYIEPKWGLHGREQGGIQGRRQGKGAPRIKVNERIIPAVEGWDRSLSVGTNTNGLEKD